MYNEYRIQLTDSSQVFDGENVHKVIHSVLTHLFEKCLERPWKKGDKNPKFKIAKTVYKKMFILTDEHLKEQSFTYEHLSYDNKTEANTVTVTKVTEHPDVNLVQGDEIEIIGTLCMSANPPKSKKRKSFVRWEYKKTKYIRDPDVFLEKLRKETGVSVKINDIAVRPIIVSPSLMPNQKQICDAFELYCKGVIDDPGLASEKFFNSVGRNATYGFGGLSFSKIEKEQIHFDDDSGYESQ